MLTIYHKCVLFKGLFHYRETSSLDARFWDVFTYVYLKENPNLLVKFGHNVTSHLSKFSTTLSYMSCKNLIIYLHFVKDEEYTKVLVCSMTSQRQKHIIIFVGDSLIYE